MTPDERKPPQTVTRKRFVDWLLGTTAGAFAVAVAYPVTRFIIPPDIPEVMSDSVLLPFSADDVPPNSGQIFKFGSQPGIIIRTPEGELRAFSARCPHLDCTVQYRDDLSHIWCACHNGHFDLQGRNVAGPPPEPLDGFDVNVRAAEITVSRRT
jgi:Rieske Fe-S protein